jgi:hypothetical protein
MARETSASCWPVVRIVLAKLVNAVLRIEPSERAVLAQGPGEVGIYRDARHEHVMSDGVRQHFGGGTDDAGHVAGGIDDRVPLPCAEDIEFAFHSSLSLRRLDGHTEVPAVVPVVARMPLIEVPARIRVREA